MPITLVIGIFHGGGTTLLRMTDTRQASSHPSHTPGPWVLRHMTPADLPAVLSIQRACYPSSMNEAETTIRARLACAPRFAWVALRDEVAAAYLMTYPSKMGKVTPLGGAFDIPNDPDCLYFHDLAVCPTAGGHGLGAALVRHALAASRWPAAALVCVQDARRFWMQQGFADIATLEAQQAAHLASYPGNACYMLRRPG